MMATTTSFIPANNTSKYYMDHPENGPSPPESYLHGKTTYGDKMSQTPPSNISPTSVTSGKVGVRQLRQPRQPMYIPAALRPTDPPARPTDIPSRPRPLDTPPTSHENSFDDGKPASVHNIGSPRTSLTGHGESPSVESSQHDLSRIVSEMWDEELGEVTGPPTTAHWKPDSSASACYICDTPFAWYFRRHHCRRCGQLVCDNHFQHSVPLDQNARFHYKGTPSRACNTCWGGWKIVKKIQHSRSSSIAGSSNSSRGTAMPIPSLSKKSDDLRVGSMARSEGGMVWSTF